MRLFNGLTIGQVIDQRDTIFLRVPVVIDEFARENDCYSNCVAKMGRDGGRVIVGWRKTQATVGAQYIATLDHHAIWQNPVGEMFDISPRVRLFKGQLEIVIDQFCDFMIDPFATFDESNRARPSHVIPTAPDPYGLLKKACNWAEYALKMDAEHETEKMRYGMGKTSELLERHYLRIRR